ncbi:MAG: AI-2E family transporter [Chloroherpetonaceae bacterium]|nr:AI-2E family transporter [Chloroherpetonaceae bacterium]MDW8437800.1 AI-2E family transporter [Chloroherpetonaceae bacterium]
MQSSLPTYLIIGLTTVLFFTLGYLMRESLSPMVIYLFIAVLCYPLRENPYVVRLFWLSTALIVIWVASVLSGLLAPFIVAFILAFLFEPLMEWLVQKKIKRSYSAVAITLLGVGSVFLAIFLIAPLITAQSQSLVNALADLPELFDEVFDSLEQMPLVKQYNIDVSALRASLVAFFETKGNGLGNLLTEALTKAARSVPTLISTLVNIVIVPVLVFYFLSDFPTIKQTLVNLIPREYFPTASEYFALAGAILRQYLRGQVIIMFILIAMYSSLFFLIGLRYSLLLGIVYGVMSFVPYVGGIIALTLSVVVALFGENVGRSIALIVVIYAVVHAIENFVLVPKIVGERVRLNPIALFLAIFLFGYFFGFFGVLSAVPLSAFLVEILNKQLALASRKNLSNDSSSQKPA